MHMLSFRAPELPACAWHSGVLTHAGLKAVAKIIYIGVVHPEWLRLRRYSSPAALFRGKVPVLLLLLPLMNKVV
jgi:hypothetical protein